MAKATRQTAAKRGAYYKARTVRWLASCGWTVGTLEDVKIIRRPNMPSFAVKRDQFGADLLAVNSARVVFVQVKLGRNNLSAARREFRKYPCPPGASQWIAVWEPGGHAPQIIEMPHDPEVSDVVATAGQQPGRRVSPARRQPDLWTAGKGADQL